MHLPPSVLVITLPNLQRCNWTTSCWTAWRLHRTAQSLASYNNSLIISLLWNTSTLETILGDIFLALGVCLCLPSIIEIDVLRKDNRQSPKHQVSLFYIDKGSAARALGHPNLLLSLTLSWMVVFRALCPLGVLCWWGDCLWVVQPCWMWWNSILQVTLLYSCFSGKWNFFKTYVGACFATFLFNQKLKIILFFCIVIRKEIFQNWWLGFSCVCWLEALPVIPFLTDVGLRNWKIPSQYVCLSNI